MLGHNCFLATLLEFSISTPWAQEAECSLDVVLSMNILLSQAKYPIQPLMAAYIEFNSHNQDMNKTLEVGLRLLILPNSKLTYISLRRNSPRLLLMNIILPKK